MKVRQWLRELKKLDPDDEVLFKADVVFHEQMRVTLLLDNPGAHIARNNDTVMIHLSNKKNNYQGEL